MKEVELELDSVRSLKALPLTHCQQLPHTGPQQDLWAGTPRLNPSQVIHNQGKAILSLHLDCFLSSCICIGIVQYILLISVLL